LNATEPVHRNRRATPSSAARSKPWMMKSLAELERLAEVITGPDDMLECQLGGVGVRRWGSGL
jgi:hypothetical protein